MVTAMAMTAWLTALFVFVAAAMGAMALAMGWEAIAESRRKKQVSQQLSKLSEEGLSAAGVEEGSILRSARDAGLFSGLNLRHAANVEVMIQQAGMSWSTHSYFLRAFGLAVAFGLSTLVASGNVLYGIIAAVLGGSLPYLYIRRKRKARLAAFEERLPEAVDLLGRAIRAGHPLTSGLKMVADETEPPIAEEFRQFFEEQRFGLPFDEALMGMAERIPLVDVRILTAAILIQREVGGNLAEILDNLADVIRQRFKIKRQLNVYTAQGRLSGVILSLLPIGVGFVVFLLDPPYMLAFLRHPAGQVMMAGAVFCQLTGYLWIRKIVNIEI